ncbi:RagB/SusD family nutrient uptake outer membrane protein [Fulvivirgaceae bacterium PWU5]|uniref:RagB/SusD family nutrient uptake outer membrane protein n=1 Tax=Dawidia cretensis TaxID=2782350 RepID=A0AAP2E512_9BACT|nr:RagB/SusD family nutrient uptake outer membrane protein [Dawidia cretensis]MBT1711934.1 RagB/SusD family nutrient uptake outer membrane protein [Dawidia cretensis]
MKLKSAVFLVFCFAFSCNDFLEVDEPASQITSDIVYDSDDTALSALAGVYSEMMGNALFAGGGLAGISLISGMSSDEFINHSDDIDRSEFYTNSLQATNSLVSSFFWEPMYKYIYYSNSILTGLENSNVSKTVSDRIEGEAKFIRAFCYFYLVNLFGEVPIVTSIDYRQNNTVKRSAVYEVYDQIIADLLQAESLLSEDYPTAERVRANKYTVKALLARVYLYQRDWVKATEQSSAVIESGTYALDTDLDVVFLNTSQEAIWQLKPVVAGFNTLDGNVFILEQTPSNVSISESLKNAFDDGDRRFDHWVGSFNDGQDTYYFPFKYKIKVGEEPFVEYSMVLRLAEQYLIRAEARWHEGDIDGAIADLDVIRERAGLLTVKEAFPGILDDQIIDLIDKERQVELFSEWGHRWLDLGRRETIDEVIGAYKPDVWQVTDRLYPIPQLERERNRNLGQNDGY